MAKYFYLNENEYKLIIDNLTKNKTVENMNLKKTLEYQFKKLNETDKSYILAAKSNIAKNYTKLYENEDILIDEDANISVLENGAYVHCWVWVDQTLKNKKIRKSVK